MDPVKGAAVIADGEPSPEIEPPEEPKQTHFFDLDDDEDEELATPKDADGPDDTIKAFQEENEVLLRDLSNLQRRMEEMMSEMEQSDKDARSLATRAEELEGELSHTQAELKHASSVAEDARADADSLRLAVKALEADKAGLEVHVRDIESRMQDLESEKHKAADEASKKEIEIRSIREESKLNLEKASAAALEKDANLFSLKEQLKKCNEEAEMERDRAKVLLLKKEEEAAVLKEELRVAKERTVEVESEKERAVLAASKACDDVRLLEHKLKLAQDMSSAEMETKEKNVNPGTLQQEELINSLEEARERDVVAEKGRAMLLASMAENEQVITSLREELEIEKKKAASVVAEKESEVESLKDELALARKKWNKELEVRNSKLDADKVLEVISVKEQLRQAMVDARRREEELEREVKQLKDVNSELEGILKELQFQVDGDRLIQNSREVNLGNEGVRKISWVSTAAAASTGTIAAAVTAFCLLQSRKR